jgi:hypothetical protein
MSYFIFKEVKIKKTREASAYDKAIRLGHDTEESTLALLKDMATIEEDGYKNVLPTLSDQQQIDAVQRLLATINGYKSSLDRAVQRLDLGKNYIPNVLDYSKLLISRYNLHQNFINSAIVKEPDMRFLYILSCMINVYPLLYKMESITRYPLKEFSYDNLDLLANQYDACHKIIEMLDEMFSLVSKDLR